MFIYNLRLQKYEYFINKYNKFINTYKKKAYPVVILAVF